MAQTELLQRVHSHQEPSAANQDEVRSAPYRSRLRVDSGTPINQDGCFDFDRIIKSGYVEKRTQRTKSWKSIYLVLRSTAISIYKNEKETKLRHQVHLSDITAVAYLKDPKHKRQHVFGIYSPSRNFHFQAPTAKDAHEWVEWIRREARIEEEEDEMFLASPIGQSPPALNFLNQKHQGNSEDQLTDYDRTFSSSPEPFGVPTPGFLGGNIAMRSYHHIDSSGLSGNELASHSDMSDTDMGRTQGRSLENLAQLPIDAKLPASQSEQVGRARALSQASLPNVELDPDRVIWQGWLLFLRTRSGVRHWKKKWAVLRPRNFILYKDGTEYTAQLVLPLSSIVNVVELDPISKSKTNCLQIITEEKGYRFCARDEESLVRCMGAFKSLLAKRRELEARAAATRAQQKQQQQQQQQHQLQAPRQQVSATA